MINVFCMSWVIRLPADYIRTLLKILIVLSLDDEGIWFVYIANDVT